ncbi:hypothetical protein CHY_0176 [Carboxydothermus hydrogenoformans Z-2901]|uniref:Uncharacterized protein n=1 Tax=Carboxydothermus hydrogenoformans (strain ATCC BAA-161 / DSM 6008 / Z-2901) TaxID=246194 RepID=Q3AFN6_CARHZ|nr:hypothetical protein CHY_0176 [Carboxydothermus hydrogenoformans Z-2901]
MYQRQKKNPTSKSWVNPIEAVTESPGGLQNIF